MMVKKLLRLKRKGDTDERSVFPGKTAYKDFLGESVLQ
jgi:hypothetical protein